MFSIKRSFRVLVVAHVLMLSVIVEGALSSDHQSDALRVHVPTVSALEPVEAREVSCGIYLGKSDGQPLPLVSGVEKLTAVDINHKLISLDSTSGIDSVLWTFRDQDGPGLFIEGNYDPRNGYVRIGVMNKSPHLNWDTDWYALAYPDSAAQSEYRPFCQYVVVGWVYCSDGDICNTAPVTLLPSTFMIEYEGKVR